MVDQHRNAEKQDGKVVGVAALATTVMFAVGAVVSMPGLSGSAGYDAMYSAMVFMAEICRF